MLIHLSPAVVLWLASAVLHVLLAFAASRTKTSQSHPVFTAYLFFQAFSSSAGLMFYLLRGGISYFATYYTLTVMGNFLGIAVSWEQAKRIFGPTLSLPAWVPVRAVSALCGLFALTFVANMIFSAAHGGDWTRTMVTFEQWTTGLMFSAFSVVLFFRYNLDISRGQKKSIGIVWGFVLYLFVAMAGVLVRAAAPAAAGILAALVSSLIYFVVLWWWGFVLHIKEMPISKATPEQTNEMLQDLSKSRERLTALCAKSKGN